MFERYICLFFLTIATGISDSYAGAFFDVLDQEPIGSILFLETRPIVSDDKSLTCSHVQRRFHELPHLIAEYREIYTNSFVGISNNVVEVYEDSLRYISEKLSTSYREQLSKKILKVRGFLPQKILDLGLPEIDGIGIYLLGKLEISSHKKFHYLPVEIQFAEGGWTITTELSAGEICLESQLTMIVLSGCERNDFEFASCQGETCLLASHYNWNKCDKKELLTLDLRPFIEKLGKNSRRMGRGS